MTEAQARKITDPSKLPWNLDCFVFVTGRYYLGMWFVSIPPNQEWPHGGNVTAQCWRFDSSPDDWVCTYRFRYYTGPQVWDSQDHKSWYTARMSGAESTIEKEMAEFAIYVSGLTGLYCLSQPPPVHSLIFKSDSKKALALVEREKPFWLHLKTSP